MSALKATVSAKAGAAINSAADAAKAAIAGRI
jgi:hypothetical protein